MIYWVLRGLVAAIFLRAGVGKLAGRIDFYWQLRASQAFPHWAEAPVSYAIPLLELYVGLGLVCPWPAEFLAEGLGLAMLIAFAAYATWVAAAGRKIRCFCFGRDDGEIGWPTVLRNSILLLALAAAMVSPNPRIGPTAAAMSLVDGFTASLLFIAIFQLRSLHREFQNG